MRRTLAVGLGQAQARHSIQSLLETAARATESSSSRVHVGRALLTQVAHRLDVQGSLLDTMTTRLSNSNSNPSSSNPHSDGVYRTAAWLTPVWKERQAAAAAHATAQAHKGLATMTWIHTDTAQACRTILALEADASAQYLQSTLTSVQARHARTVETLAEVVVGLRTGTTPDEAHAQDMATDPTLVATFLRQRLGMQLLCEHYMDIVGNSIRMPKPAGTMDVERSVADAVLDAMGECKVLTEAFYEHPPPLVYRNHDTMTTEDDDIKATWVGPWLHYVLVEVLKNATTATVEQHPARHAVSSNEENTLPPIEIRAHQDDRTTYIYIEDRGTGLGSTLSTDCFRFAQTDHIWDRMDEQTTYAMVRSPLRGLGVGLSLSSAMMHYFGGALRLEARGNGGTRVVLEMPRDLTILEAALVEPEEARIERCDPDET
jgi:hypothetical protein